MLAEVVHNRQHFSSHYPLESRKGMQILNTALILSLVSFKSTVAQAIVTTILETASPITITNAPSSTPPSPQYTDPSALQSAVLNSTNTYRHQHNATDLTWNDTLASYAKSQASACKFAHSHGPYGENLAEGYPDITSTVDSWGDERSKYNFGDGQFSESTGHFTQLVWKNTTSTGCGVKSCGSTGWLVFCEYSPAGNVIGQFAQEVQKQIPGVEGPGSPVPSSGSAKPHSEAPPKNGKLSGYVQHVHAQLGGAERLRICRYIWAGTAGALFVAVLV